MAKIKYNGETLAEIKAGQSITLHTDGHELDGDLVIEGFNGGGSSNCDGCIIEVEELPTKGDETALYKMGESYYQYGDKFKDILIVDGGVVQSFVDANTQLGATINLYYVKTRPTENIVVSGATADGVLFACYYVEDENDILLYGDFGGNGTNEWMSMLSLMGGTFGGAITDASQATTEGTVYALVNNGWTEYRVLSRGVLNITDNGIFDVTDIASVNVNIAGVCGIWRFNETVQIGLLNLTQNVNFTTTIEGKVYECTGMWVDASNYSDPTHLVYHGDGVPSIYETPDHWLYDSARTVNYGAEPQAVHPKYKSWLINNATRIDGEDSIKASTEAEMDAVLEIAETGSVVKYTGESTDTYENGGLYIVEAVV